MNFISFCEIFEDFQSNMISKIKRIVQSMDIIEIWKSFEAQKISEISFQCTDVTDLEFLNAGEYFSTSSREAFKNCWTMHVDIFHSSGLHICTYMYVDITYFHFLILKWELYSLGGTFLTFYNLQMMRTSRILEIFELITHGVISLVTCHTLFEK